MPGWIQHGAVQPCAPDLAWPDGMHPIQLRGDPTRQQGHIIQPTALPLGQEIWQWGSGNFPLPSLPHLQVSGPVGRSMSWTRQPHGPQAPGPVQQSWN